MSVISAAVDAAGRLERVGPYRVLDVVGRGGMGIVYRVRRDDNPDGVPLALKTIESRFFSNSESNAPQRFMQEIRVLERLEHPSVVRFRDAGVARDKFGSEIMFLVTDFLEGTSLRLRLKSERLSQGRALEWFAQVLDALIYLDAQSVVHRDLTPNNIFILNIDRAILIDFGLARSDELTRLTQSGMIVGSFRYMAPERLMDRGGDIRADIFALGTIVFEMLAGRPAFSITENRLTELLRNMEQGLPWTPELRLAVGDDLARLLETMVDPDPERRPRPALLGSMLRAVITPVTGTRHRAETPVEEPPRRPKPLDVPEPSPVEPAATEARERTGFSGLVVAAIAVTTFAGGLAGGLVGASMLEHESPADSAPALARPVAPSPVPRIIRSAPEAPIEKQPAIEKPARPDLRSDEAAFAYGRYARLEGQLETARWALERAVALNPVMAEAHRELGELLRQQNDREGALRHFQLYLALRPTASDAAAIKAWIDASTPP